MTSEAFFLAGQSILGKNFSVSLKSVRVPQVWIGKCCGSSLSDEARQGNVIEVVCRMKGANLNPEITYLALLNVLREPLASRDDIL